MISDYATLQQAIADELARADLTNAIPNFIQLAEADIARQVRHRSMMALATGTSSAGVITLPADYREAQALYIDFGGTRVEIPSRGPESLADFVVPGAVPTGYVTVGNTLVLVGSTLNVAYTLLYFNQIPALSSASPQNWLLTREPGLYLYTALAHSAPYLQDDPRIELWLGLAKGIRDSMKSEDDGARYATAAQRRVSGLFP